MSEVSHSHGFRIAGPVTGNRTRVAAARAFEAYCLCHDNARVGEEAYLSAFCFDDSFAAHMHRTGSTAGFEGSTWSPFIWLDIDRGQDEGGMEAALRATRSLANTLCDSFETPRGALVPFVSGGKGFHLGVPTALWLPSAGRDFHLVAREFAGRIAEVAAVRIDEGVFDRVRAFRAPNSRHPRTGLHKRHIPAEALDELTAEEVIESARHPLPFAPPQVFSEDICDSLAVEWDNAKRRALAQTSVAGGRRTEIIGRRFSGSINRLTRRFIAGDVAQGDRHRTCYSAAANLAELGCPFTAVRELLTEPALDSGLPPKEAARTIEDGYASVQSLVSRAAEAFDDFSSSELHPEAIGGT
jgi:hypothetical protein